MKKSVAIIGSGPSALMLACMLDEKKFSVTIFEKKAAPARKFLVAGDGGLNLTHAEPLDDFVSRYTPSSFLEKIIRQFSNTDLRVWLKSIGIETYVGSSKRIFPTKETKPIDVLNAILKVMKSKGHVIKTAHTWVGWNKNKLTFLNGNNEKNVDADIVVFALGGGSWSVTGSDGAWKPLFETRNVTVNDFEPSNCALAIRWTESLLIDLQGKALKNITIKCGEKEKKGEVVITRFGMEGGAIYALGPQIRKQLKQKNEALIYIDLKPTLSETAIAQKIKLQQKKKSITNILQKDIGMNKTQIVLLKHYLSKEEFVNENILAKKIKNFTLYIIGMASLDEAISTAGGIALSEIDDNFQLKKIPNHYAIGEMLNWDAPTGGYLLQACFSMGYVLANHLNRLR